MNGDTPEQIEARNAFLRGQYAQGKSGSQRAPELRVFIGYDERQPLAFNVLSHSIWRHSCRPLSITRLQLKGLPMKRRGLTEFTYSRFLVPYLCNYEGYSLFMDSDVLCRADVYELLLYPAAYPDKDVFVSKNKLRYEWPSVMLFQNEKCKTLTPEYVDNEKNPLFDFAWAKDVGAFLNDWNHLVGYDPPNPNAKIIHYTQGVPCWPETWDTEFAEEWREEVKQMSSTVTFQELMGNSVHAKHVYERLKKQG